MLSPVSTCGVNSGLCLPRRRLAISVASLPRVLSVASTRHQSRFTVCGFATYVLISFSQKKPTSQKAAGEEREFYWLLGPGATLARSDFQAVDRFAMQHMGFYDLVNVRLVDVGIPGALGINHADRAFFATVKAASLVHTHPACPGNPQFPGLFLGVTP